MRHSLPIWRRTFLALALGAVFGGVARADGISDEEALAREYRTLRLLRGHFSGGEWNDAVDRFGGRKHQVMAALGEKLGDGKHSRKRVIALMGAPDEIFLRGRPMFRQFYDGRDRRVRELLVYHWRGRHDFLFFASDGRRVLASDWWAALE